MQERNYSFHKFEIFQSIPLELKNLVKIIKDVFKRQFKFDLIIEKKTVTSVK